MAMAQSTIQFGVALWRCANAGMGYGSNTRQAAPATGAVTPGPLPRTFPKVRSVGRRAALDALTTEQRFEVNAPNCGMPSVKMMVEIVVGLRHGCPTFQLEAIC